MQELIYKIFLENRIVLSKKWIDELLAYDKNFDFSLFKLKNLNIYINGIMIINCTSFKIGDKSYSDVNTFISNLKNITSLTQILSPDGVYREIFVKHLYDYTFTYHSYNQPARYNEYYIDGNKMSKDEWLEKCREKKLNRILDK
jgi:hypothetical protein